MRRNLTSAALAVAALAIASSAAHADCTTEVATAFATQKEKKFVRKDTDMLTENGPVKMTLEFQLPDRMRQSVKAITDPKPTQTIVIGLRAWTQDGDEWFELPPQAAEQVVDFMKKSVALSGDDMGRFECQGTDAVDGKQLRIYRGLAEEQKDANGKPVNPADLQNKQNEAVRLIYVDPATGLPARATYGRKDTTAKPIYQEVYSFPETISIEAPAVKAQAPIPAPKTAPGVEKLP
jgi:hypothetical protein